MWHVQCVHCTSDCDPILNFTDPLTPLVSHFLDFHEAVEFLGLFCTLSSECGGHVFFSALFSLYCQHCIFFILHTPRVAANFSTSIPHVFAILQQ